MNICVVLLGSSSSLKNGGHEEWWIYVVLNEYINSSMWLKQALEALCWLVEVANEMKLGWSVRKNRIVRLMWVEGEPISLIFSIRGYIHNDDGSIWDIYDVEKQVF